ncbi:MAG: alginate export family protein [Verrucomicrobiota bacterium]
MIKQVMITVGCILSLGLSSYAGSSMAAKLDVVEPTCCSSGGGCCASKPERPTIGWLRYNEDWSVMKDLDNKLFTDPLKYIPFNEKGDIYLSLGGQVRQRVEVWNNFGFNSNNDDTFLLSRYQAHADLHVTKYFRVFAEGIYAHIPDDRSLPGGVRSALDANEGDLLNLFVDFNLEIGDADVTLRGGRQQFLFGKQRIISPLPWVNNYRKWDGFSSIIKYEDWKLTPFYAWFVPVDKFEFDNIAGTEDTGNGASTIWGAYLENKNIGDFYYIGRNASNAEDNSSHTIGARRASKIGDTGFDYELELAFQFLNSATDDDFAYMLGGHIGYTFADVWAKPWLYTGVEMGSASYDQVFPLGHAYFGFIDALGRGNTIDWKTGIKFSPIKKLTVAIDHHMFFREDTDAATTNVGGGFLRAGSTTDEGYIGNEIDITAKYPLPFLPGAAVLMGYSHFFAGDYLDDTGTAEDIDFFYTQLMYRF